MYLQEKERKFTFRKKLSKKYLTFILYVLQYKQVKRQHIQNKKED